MKAKHPRNGEFSRIADNLFRYSSSGVYYARFQSNGKDICRSLRTTKFLHTRKLWRAETAEKRLAILARAGEFCGSPAVTAAKSLLAVSLAKTLQTVQNQLDQYREQIQRLFAQHGDNALFGSLPGVGPMLAPRLLGEIGGDPERFEDTGNLQCVAGTAPVSFQSGNIHKVRVRYQCNKVLRHTVHLWAACCLREIAACVTDTRDPE
jgi:transposase